MPAFALATVTATSPLTVVMDGDAAAVNVPAKSYSGYTPVVGDRVRLELRTPLPPQVVGKVA